MSTPSEAPMIVFRLAALLIFHSTEVSVCEVTTDLQTGLDAEGEGGVSAGREARKIGELRYVEFLDRLARDRAHRAGCIEDFLG